MTSSKPLSAWRISLAATVAGVALGATAAQAQTSRDPLELDPVRPDSLRNQLRQQEGRRPPAQSLTIQPRVGVRTLVTDNVYLTSTNHQTDLVVNPFVGVAIDAYGPRSSAEVSVDAGYDSYSRAHQLNGFTYVGSANGDYDIVSRLLRLEASGSITNGNVSFLGSPALDRSGVDGRTQVVNLSLGPRLTTTVGDLLDMSALARVRWVGFNADSANAFTPEDATIREASVAVTTGDRFASHEIRASATYQEDDSDFRLYSALASVFVPVTPDIRIFARGGVDDISQPLVIDLQAPIWSVGVEYQFSGTSYARFEGGRRYHDTTFAAESRIDVTDRFYFVGSYLERIQPAQISLNDNFLSFATNTNALPTALSQNNFTISDSLFNETSKDRVGVIRGVYVWPDQELSLDAAWTHRHLLGSNTSNEFTYATAAYSRKLRPDLRAEASVSYGLELNDATRGGDTRKFGGSVTVIFVLNPSVEIRGGYAYSNEKQKSVGGRRIVENVAFASLAKSF